MQSCSLSELNPSCQGMKFIVYFTWFVALTATVKGSYKSCGEIQDAKVNSSTFYSITIGGKSVQVSCNMTSQPAETIIPLQHVIHVKTGGKGYNVDYGTGSLSANHIQEFIEQSEICKQQVSYRCSNSTPLVGKQFPLLYWTSIDDSPRYYWPGCSLSDKTCRCDPETSMTKDDYTYLAKKKDLPLTSLQFGALPSGSNISVTVGDIVCQGDSQKDAFTFGDQNSFVSLNVSSMKELKFKFRRFKLSKQPKEDQVIASFQVSAQKPAIKIRLDSELVFIADRPKFDKVDEEWHTVVLTVENQELRVGLNGIKKTIVEAVTNTVGAKLVLGDPERKCKAFFGCIKDLTVDGEDYTAMIREATMQEYVEKGCAIPDAGRHCTPAKVPDTDSDPDSTTSPPVIDPTSTRGSREKKNETKNDDDDDDDDVVVEGDGNDDDAAIIAIVVVFLILLIILIVVFFITWYLKRNKGVYQTHEGSAENIHGDTDNLTLVTKPCDQDADADQGKEYYL